MCQACKVINVIKSRYNSISLKCLIQDIVYLNNEIDNMHRTILSDINQRPNIPSANAPPTPNQYTLICLQRKKVSQDKCFSNLYIISNGLKFEKKM